jgi:hypothetical protein
MIGIFLAKFWVELKKEIKDGRRRFKLNSFELFQEELESFFRDMNRFRHHLHPSQVFLTLFFLFCVL